MKLGSRIRLCVVGLSLALACSSPGGEDPGSSSASVVPTSFCSGHLPDPGLTPGKLCTPSDPNFQGLAYPEHIARCVRNVSTAEKNAIGAAYGVPQSQFSNYEFDHYIPLSIGGSDDPTNLWPQPHAEAVQKDALELQLFHQISAGTVTQASAIAQIRAWRPAGGVANGCGGDAGVPDSGAPDSGAHDASVDAHPAPDASSDAGGGHAIKHVFLIMMENHNWSQIAGSASAPYINGTLLPAASHAENYFNPPGNHPSEPNYLWLESGGNLGVSNDGTPSANHQSTTAHLATQLDAANIAWKSYQEDISGTVCPLTITQKYAPKHNPFVFFDDLTGGLSANDPGCIAHNRPYSELAADLQSNSVARYNFITPNLCNDMHNKSGCAQSDSVNNGDTWLSHEIPKILASAAYQNGGAIFITWDESEGGDVPVGMIVLSPLAKGNGYSNTIKYTHSSTLRTMQEIFGTSPLLRDAANATSLSDLFTSYP